MSSEAQKDGSSTLSGLVGRLARRVLRRLSVHENVVYGDNFRVGRSCVVSSPHGLIIGDSVSVGPFTTIQVDGEIGDFALIGMGVQIVGRDDHAIDEVGVPYFMSTWVAERDPRPRDRVDIGRDVWVGGRATILGGVTIGEGALIGAGAVVTRDIPAYSIAVGNPARVVGERFPASLQQAHADGLDSYGDRTRPRVAGKNPKLRKVQDD